jgi:hypothetical protein
MAPGAPEQSRLSLPCGPQRKQRRRGGSQTLPYVARFNHAPHEEAGNRPIDGVHLVVASAAESLGSL